MTVRHHVDAITASLNAIDELMRDRYAVGALALEFKVIAERAAYLGMTPDEQRVWLAQRMKEAA